jgi:hypothetical protein
MNVIASSMYVRGQEVEEEHERSLRWAKESNGSAMMQPKKICE